MVQVSKFIFVTINIRCPSHLVLIRFIRIKLTIHIFLLKKMAQMVPIEILDVVGFFIYLCYSDVARKIIVAIAVKHVHFNCIIIRL